ncbi:primosomal protein N' [Acinetobacter nectaris CIP 110549]|uniref:Replication restart protein PriA n=1 Tax=Acinetobacter nectaris CIP 110549 TaxID=1392540 RepID=V2TTS8_9GAMM|nr:primosomal protein N' [Acinetobacter nectaris]ESK39700.1 primosomal protein N' [Acinetobacter nectaris CIP 110549]
MVLNTVTSSHPLRIRVAVPLPLHDCFDYLVTAEQYTNLEIGSRVKVPFGRQQCIAVVMEKVPPNTPQETKFKLKHILEVLDPSSLITQKVISLLKWSAQYYLFPIGEVVQSAFPTRLRQGYAYARTAPAWKVIDFDANEKLKRSEKQRTAYTHLLRQIEPCFETSLINEGFSLPTLRALEKKQIIQETEKNIDFSAKPIQLAQIPLTANEDQKNAIDQILEKQDTYQAFLLDGITGSGKTEVYLQVMYDVLKQGKQVLVLVPEIGLTSQTISRFRARFDCHITLLHSGLTDVQRLHAWQQAQTGQASIILGTRSAIYTPLPHLGLIILDEEHDLSFKQQDGFRYHARDVALYRAYLEKCPIILGSATPSIDSFALVEQKKIQHLTLNTRTGNAVLPKMHLIDLKVSPKVHGLSQYLIGHIKQRLQQQEQVLIFLNRRGYAPVLMCEHCGWQANCPNCDAHFTLHTQPYQHLHCHHCGLIQVLPPSCPECKQETLKPIGLGTVKVEDGLKELFPDTEIIRVDRDSTSRVGSLEKIYEKIHQNKPLILLGTQMLAKGHHFPYVTLVAILDIDAGLLSVDFRAPERTAQMIVQVSGRAGRGEKKGEVFLQTLRPDHPTLNTLISKDYRVFAQQTLKERQTALLPPYRYTVLVRSESKDEQKNLQFLTEISKNLQEISAQHLEIWGPIPAPMQRKAGKYQAHLVILGKERAHLHYYVRHWWSFVLSQCPTHIRLSIDVDPQELN